MRWTDTAITGEGGGFVPGPVRAEAAGGGSPEGEGPAQSGAEDGGRRCRRGEVQRPTAKVEKLREKLGSRVNYDYASLKGGRG